MEVNPNDISSYSNFDKIKQTFFDIKVSIDIDKKILDFTMITTYSLIDTTCNEVILDLKGPKISSIEYISSDSLLISLPYTIFNDNPHKEALGTPLTISLRDLPQKEKEHIISLKELKLKTVFITDSTCQGMQFLSKDQTTTKMYPFMFTQCEPILCRALIPCQDTPSTKAKVHVKTIAPKDITFLFGGLLESESFDTNLNKNIRIYNQPIPIPTYLIAFAAGYLERGKISERCGVWTERGLVSKGVYEFEDAEKYIKYAEEYFNHPYEWKIYDLLVLPFSFPYGGMENPNLTFVTPSLLAGDKSLSNVIGHEISHSWTGNLVTNKDWANFWVNEGFTTFMERKLDGLLLGEEMENLEAIVGHSELKEDINAFGNEHEYTKLSANYKNANPDDGFSVVPYEKGYQFLYRLEGLIGKDHFKKIMGIYIKKYRLQSVDYTAFKGIYEEYVKSNFKDYNKILGKIDWQKELYSTGIHEMPDFKSKYLDEVKEFSNDILGDNGKLKNRKEIFTQWHTNVKLIFMNEMFEKVNQISKEKFMSIRSELELAEKYNDEIKYIWYQIALKKNIEEDKEYIKKFLSTHGRFKYIRPVYSAWRENNYDEALKIFNENKMLYHSFPRGLIAESFKK